MKFVLLINLKLLTIANSFLLDIAEHENMKLLAFALAGEICSAELSMKKSYNLGARCEVNAFIRLANSLEATDTTKP